MAYDVFISHASNDKAIADAVCAALEAEKIRCWIAPRDIRSGEHWAEAINSAIKKTRVMVLIFSKNSNQSKQVARELTLAANAESVIIPFKIDNILPTGVIEFYLLDTHWLDAMNPPTERQLQGLVQTVVSYIGLKKASPAETRGNNLSDTAAKDAQEKDYLTPVQGERNINKSKTAPKKTKYPYKKLVLLAAAILGCGLLVFTAVKQFQGIKETDQSTLPSTDDPSILVQSDELSQVPGEGEGLNIPGLPDADYYIDYENGTIPLGNLPIGARVVDPSWEWEFRTGRNYTRETGDETKPVTWIVVAIDHYSDQGNPLSGSHVTLLSEELIANYVFDGRGSNHWGNSGTANASWGLRPWLNSISIHKDEGFYRAFSNGFRSAVLSIKLPNREWVNGNSYSTEDHVFIPSTTELGDTSHDDTYRIGSTYPYFQGMDNTKRVALLGATNRWYWTRSPASTVGSGGHVRCVHADGEFGYSLFANYFIDIGVRPAVNLKSEVLVSENMNFD